MDINKIATSLNNIRLAASRAPLTLQEHQEILNNCNSLEEALVDYKRLGDAEQSAMEPAKD